jgi:hypothetical protein
MASSKQDLKTHVVRLDVCKTHVVRLDVCKTCQQITHSVFSPIYSRGEPMHPQCVQSNLQQE